MDAIVQKSFDREPFYASEAAEANAEGNAEECLSRPADLKSGPTRVRLELTNACNLECVFCYRAHFKTTDRNLLTPKDIEILAPILKTAKFISLSQKCESLISPHFIPILEAVAKHGAVTSIYTNAQYMTKAIAAAMVKNKLTFLTVSCSVFNEGYKDFYKGGTFKKLVENIEYLNELKRASGSSTPRMRVSFVLRKDTLDNLDDALEFVQKHKFSEGIQILSFYRIVEEDRKYELSHEWDSYKPVLDRFVEKANKAGVLLDFSTELPHDTKAVTPEEYTKICAEPWESFNVAPGGDVMMCATGNTPVGNIRAQAPLEIWNGDTCREFRRRMNGKPFNKDCSECWHCRFVLPQEQGKKMSKLNTIFGIFHRTSPVGGKKK